LLRILYHKFVITLLGIVWRIALGLKHNDFRHEGFSGVSEKGNVTLTLISPNKGSFPDTTGTEILKH
jgi:hypothetical protein